VNNTHSRRIKLPAPAINTIALDELCLNTSGHLASFLKTTIYLIGDFGRIVAYERGRQSAAKEQPHREVGTQSLRTSVMRWPGYPRYRDVSALFSVVYSAVLFAMQAMRIETQPTLR
jgi:hypothetical protein